MEACLGKTEAMDLEANRKKYSLRQRMRRSLRKGPQWKLLEH
jgi:hypothetical protein